ncbi:MAG: UvrB/UvrC motif-containing protein [Phycisphaerae bacterium]
MKKPPRDPFGLDISSALRGWQFEAGQVNVRLIRGADGKPKLQLRLDLGLLQMELIGRPDGKRPHHAATELDFQTRKLRRHLERHGTDTGFTLTSSDCQSLREESAMFYHRYLSLFVLEQYEAVIRDTQHNLGVLDICNKYAKGDYDRMCLEQYRPYILMMHTRARACEALRHNYTRTAVAYLRGGIKQILRLMPKESRPDAREHSHEIHVLMDMLRQLRAQLPPDPRLQLKKKLQAALAAEKYEVAARLRDELLALHTAGQQPRKKKRAANVESLKDAMNPAPPVAPAPAPSAPPPAAETSTPPAPRRKRKKPPEA